MTRRMLIAAVFVAVPCAVQAQSPAPAKPAQAPAAAAAPAPDLPGYTYNPEGRRDPFVSLTRRGSDAAAEPVAKTSGLPGLTADDLNLRGVLVSRNEFVGIVQGSDNKTYIVRAGQKLLDGTIRAIDKDSMVIVQQVNDPLSLDKQREMRKVLRQDEAK